MLRGVKILPKTIKRAAAVTGLAKAPKLSEVSVWLNVENPNGTLERVRGRVGDSLWVALNSNNSYIGGYCTAEQLEWNLREKPVEPNADEPYCTFCAVEIGDHWFHRMQIHNKEAVINQDHRQMPIDHSRKRLACCVTLEPWMDEMFVRVPIHAPRSPDDTFDEHFTLV